MDPSTLDRLRAVVGPTHVITDPSLMTAYLTDWTLRWSGAADAVVRPRTTAETSAVVAACAHSGIPITAQGGNTGLVGGSVPDGGIVLSTKRMVDIDAVDTIGCTVGAQAGATVEAVDRHANAAGLCLGIDLASRTSATVGGIVATNAGGIRFIRHGSTRSQLAGIEAVMADGRIVSRLSALAKDNVGYDLPGLLTGSEGTLAIITRVLFRLAAPPSRTVVFVAAVYHASTALEILSCCRETGLIIEAAELMTDSGIKLVSEYGARAPMATPAPFYVLIEVSGSGDLMGRVSGLLDSGVKGLVDAVAEYGPARRLWHIRESHTESIARATGTPVVKLDVSVPLAELDAAIADLQRLTQTVDAPCRTILFGHVGDGNIHVNLLDVPTAKAEHLVAEVFGIITKHRGSISAEHGIGRAKTAWTHLGRNNADLDAMRAIKTALDPAGIFNPGVLFAAR